MENQLKPDVLTVTLELGKYVHDYMIIKGYKSSTIACSVLNY